LPADRVAEAGRRQQHLDGGGLGAFLSSFHGLAERIVAGNPYPVNALLLYNANLVSVAPGGERFVEALQKTPLIVDFSSVMNETSAYADFILPDHTYLERYQDDIIEGLGYPGVALRQPAVPPVHDTRNAADVLLQLAQGMGGEMAAAFPWRDFAELIKFRLVDLGVAWDDLKTAGVWSKPPYKFADRGSKEWAGVVGRDRNSFQDGRFDFSSRMLRCTLQDVGDDSLAAQGIQARGERVYLPHYEPSESAGEADQYPFVLNAFETMTQPRAWDGIIPSLQDIVGLNVGVRWGSWLEIHPHAAEKLGIAQGDEVSVESLAGRLSVRAHLWEGVRPDVVSMPLQQAHRSGRTWGQEQALPLQKALTAFLPQTTLLQVGTGAASTGTGEIGTNPNRLIAGAVEPGNQSSTSKTRVRVHKV